jgi:hypothetical protein
MNHVDEDTKVWLGNDCARLTTVRRKTAPKSGSGRCLPWSQKALKRLSPTELPPWMQIPPEVKKKKKESVQSGWKAHYESALKCDDMSSGAGREAAKAALLALGVSLPRGEKYNNLEEGMEQLMRLPYKSPQRRAAIKLMCQGGYFSDKEATIYKHLKKAAQLKNDCVPPQKTNNTSTFGFGSEGGGYTDNDYARYNIREAIRWKGSIILSVIPASVHPAPSCYQQQPTYGVLQSIDICSLIGNSDFAIDAVAESLPNDPHTKNWQEMCKKEGLAPKEINKNFARSVAKKRMLDRRITKLYFEPEKYPPPEGEWDASDDIVFGHLKNYVQNSAKLCGSPLVYNGGDYQTRFRCGHWYRRSEGKERPLGYEDSPYNGYEDAPYNSHCCTFTFVVRCDELGYYIPVNLENGRRNCNYGCGWHCCEKTG